MGTITGFSSGGCLHGGGYVNSHVFSARSNTYSAIGNLSSGRKTAKIKNVASGDGRRKFNNSHKLAEMLQVDKNLLATSSIFTKQ